MKCPMCGGDFTSVVLKTSSAESVLARQCGQCAGIWLEREPSEPLSGESVREFDTAAANYSLAHHDLVCPLDNSLLSEVDSDDLPAGIRYWHCTDCSGSFYPKGQLAAISKHQNHSTAHQVAAGRTQVTIASVLVVGLIVLVNASWRQMEGDLLTLEASTDQVLPGGSLSFLTLILLVACYLAGTALAVMGRRTSLVAMGWGVIAICLAGFFVVVLGP